MTKLKQLYKEKENIESKFEEVKNNTSGMLWTLLGKELMQDSYNKVLNKIKQLKSS